MEADRIERAERRFRHELWRAAPVDAVVEGGVETHFFGPLLATVYAEYPEIASLSTILGAAEPGAVEAGHLAAAIEWMREWEVDYLVPVACDRPGTALAEAWLSGRGYEQGAVTRRYLRAAAAPDWRDAPGVEVLELAPEEGEGMDFLAAEVFGLPETAGVVLFCGLPELEGWRCYVALLDGELAACGSMLLDGEIAVLGVDATAVRGRGRGCNLALLRRRLEDAAKAGCSTVLAEAGDDPGRGSSAAGRNLVRAGFEEASRSIAWRRPVSVRVR